MASKDDRAIELVRKLRWAGFEPGEEMITLNGQPCGTMFDDDIVAWIHKGIGSAGSIVNRLSRITNEQNDQEF